VCVTKFKQAEKEACDRSFMDNGSILFLGMEALLVKPLNRSVLVRFSVATSDVSTSNLMF